VRLRLLVQGSDPINIAIGVQASADSVAKITLPLWERAARVVLQDWVPGVWQVTDNNNHGVVARVVSPAGVVNLGLGARGPSRIVNVWDLTGATGHLLVSALDTNVSHKLNQLACLRQTAWHSSRIIIAIPRLRARMQVTAKTSLLATNSTSTS
jgi:hypothetical protein